MSFFDFPVYDLPQDKIDSAITVDGPHIYVQTSAYGDPEQGLLQKIIGAAKFDLSTLPVTMLQDDQHAAALERGIKTDQLVIAFGIAPDRLGLNCEAAPYQIINIAGKSLLFSHDLTTLSASAPMKKALWGALKHFYNL